MFDIYLAHDSQICLARDSFRDVLRHYLGPEVFNIDYLGDADRRCSTCILAHDSHICLARDSFSDVVRHYLWPDFINSTLGVATKYAIVAPLLKIIKHLQVGIKFVTITIGSIVKWSITDVN
jgi:hypothetical protein